MEKLVRLTLSPENPSIEVVDKMVMKVHGPYSENDVTIQFNPNIREHKESKDRENIQIRQVTVTTPTDQIKIFHFDFKTDNVHEIEIENTLYNVKLMFIGKAPIHGQQFPYFEFYITSGSK